MGHNFFSFSGALVLSVHCNCNGYRTVDMCFSLCSAETCFISNFSRQFCMELVLLIYGKFWTLNGFLA